MRAVRDSESASVSIGLDPTLIRTTAFGISAVAAGIAGGVYASISNFISPELFPFFQSILFLLVVMLGGADRVLGPLVGALVVVLLPELLATLGQYRLLFVGVLMLAGAAAGTDRPGRTDRPRVAEGRPRDSRERTLRYRPHSRLWRKRPVDRGARSGGEFRRRARRQKSQLRRAPGRDHQHHRPERRRQKHRAQRHLRLLSARCRDRHSRGPRRLDAARLSNSRAPASRAPIRPASCSRPCRSSTTF